MKPLFTITDWIAIWGGITGSISLCISYFSYKRDNAKIKLVFRKGWTIMRSPDHDPRIKYASLTVYNQGRRPITISKAGYMFLKLNGGAILSDSMMSGSRKLDEGTNTDYLIKETQLEELSEINYFVVYDAAGRSYKLYISPYHLRIWYWFLNITQIRKKLDVVDNN